MTSTVKQILDIGKNDSVAICAPDQQSMTYDQLRELTNKTIRSLNDAGIGRDQRVAIVLPNGPEMATAFVTIASAATTAPLNPSYRQEEFEFYLDDLNAKALVLEKDSESEARMAAEKLGIQIITLVKSPDGIAGKFELEFDSSHIQCIHAEMVNADDVALILHTSGTTSRPKIVPLSHQNLAASASHIVKTLSLSHTDVCLNIMPLFHIHGLIAAVLSTLRAGGCVYCSPGFNALKFFQWMEEAQPTWYTAVPTMHQAILSRAARNKSVIEVSPLKFIRSSSSSLPPQVMSELEAVFNVPVIESYGMTEATHQMTSNPLPPNERKAGSVGIAAGPEVNVMDEKGQLMPQGSIGEVVIRGLNVTRGYENNPTANAENFTNGWFRTGDQGVIDEEGYVSITGRLKEIINRGGEKISPREVDEVLMDHPSIQQCVTFAMPHSKLGEDVAAAVVLVEGKSSDENAIREFTANRLVGFKVPAKVLILDEIPKGATGKLQRIGLAEKLGLA